MDGVDTTSCVEPGRRSDVQDRRFRSRELENDGVPSGRGLEIREALGPGPPDGGVVVGDLARNGLRRHAALTLEDERIPRILVAGRLGVIDLELTAGPAEPVDVLLSSVGSEQVQASPLVEPGLAAGAQRPLDLDRARFLRAPNGDLHTRHVDTGRRRGDVDRLRSVARREHPRRSREPPGYLSIRKARAGRDKGPRSGGGGPVPDGNDRAPELAHVEEVPVPTVMVPRGDPHEVRLGPESLREAEENPVDLLRAPAALLEDV